MKNELVPVVQQHFHEEAVNTVNGRNIWEFLDIRRDFSDWVKDQIQSLDLVENVDFITFHEKVEGGRFAKIEYYVTLDVAKHICMVSRTPRGRELRQYFIECEKALLHRQPTTMEALYNIIGAVVEQERINAQQTRRIQLLEEHAKREEYSNKTIEWFQANQEKRIDRLEDHIVPKEDSQWTTVALWITEYDPIMRPQKNTSGELTIDDKAIGILASQFSKWVKKMGYLEAEGIEQRKVPQGMYKVYTYPVWFIERYYWPFRNRQAA
jgi:phage anti-repressor protein